MSSQIKATQRLIHTGRDNLMLVCAARLWPMPNGDLICTWLSGSDNEPASDNCVAMSRSTDGGRTWSEAQVLLESGEAATALAAMIPQKDGRVVAFGAYWPYDEHYTTWHFFRMESTDSGYTWSERTPIRVHDGKGSLDMPIRLKNGELLFPGALYHPRPQPLVAPVQQLCEAQSEEEALAMPAVEGAEVGGKFSTHLHACCAFISADENATQLEEYGDINNRPLGLLEPVCVQLRDGRIVMLMRAEWGGFLWRAESSDNGRTWTKAWETDIPNPSSHTSLIRLPDGRIALIHNPAGRKGTRGPRSPLSIWISDDELESWSVKQDLFATSGNVRPHNWPDGLDRLAYPHAQILDGKLVFVYDRNRRDAMFVEVEL
jgi:hypothetical protein